MKVAFIHEWFTFFAGSEKVLEIMNDKFPNSDIYALIDVIEDRSVSPILRKKITTTFIQKFPFAKYYYRFLLPLFPLAIEQLNLSGYDLIISNSHAVAKGVVTGPNQLHICMCYTPMRYAWDLQEQYLKESGFKPPFSWLARWFLHKIRIWDSRTSNGVDYFMAVSSYISRRIWKAYRRESTVVYCNVDTDSFRIGPPAQNFYFAASRIVPYKKMRLIVEAFNEMPERKLVVIGAGPGLKTLRKIAKSNVEIMGYQPHAVLLEKMQTARAFVFAAEEDFGIVLLEAQACGTPVVAFSLGGAAETVIDGTTGIHFHEQSVSAITAAVKRFEETEASFDRDTIRTHALKFSTQAFVKKFSDFVDEKWKVHQDKLRSRAEI